MDHTKWRKLIMAALRSRCGHYIFPLWFLHSISFFPSPILSRRRLDVYHTSTHGVDLVPIWDAGLKRAVRGSLKIQDPKNRQKFAICTPLHNFVGLYPRNWGTYRQSEKNLLNSNISATCPHNMVNFGPLAAEIGSLVWGTSANFNGFRFLASILQRHRWTEANQTLHDVWPSPGLVHYIYVFGGSCLLTEFFHVQKSLCVQVLRSPIWAALLHGMWAAAVSQTLWRGMMELPQRAPPIFSWAAITLGIGPHSS